MRRFLHRVRADVTAFLSRKDPAELFALLVLTSFSLFLVRALAGRANTFISVFHLHGTDLFMDFFNSIRDASRGAGAYTDRYVMYPPMANLLLWLASRLFPQEYLDTPGKYAGTWHYYPGAILAFLCLFAGVFLAFALVLLREPYTRKKRRALTVAVLFSLPFVFLYERGNTVFLALIFLVIFVQNYDSESKVAREAGLLSLAFAASLKLYPAIFGAVLLTDKRYKEAGRCVIYGILLLVLPSFVFGGPVSILWSMKDALSYSGTTSLPFLKALAGYGVTEEAATLFLRCFYAFVFLFFAVSSLFPRRRFVTFAFGACCCMMLPSIFSAYNWALFLPALLLFFRQEKLRGLNIVYFCLMTLPFCLFIEKAYQDNIIIGAIVVLSLLCAGESVAGAVRDLRRGKHPENREEKSV